MLKAIVALAGVAVIAGSVGTGQLASAGPRNRGLPLASNSEAAKVLVQACGNCHSDQTDWPWYGHVAPVSWWIARHVREGRKQLDFSQWESYSARQKIDKLDSICGLISTARMPPWAYTLMHPEARLTEENKNAVCGWAKEQSLVAR